MGGKSTMVEETTARDKLTTVNSPVMADDAMTVFYDLWAAEHTETAEYTTAVERFTTAGRPAMENIRAMEKTTTGDSPTVTGDSTLVKIPVAMAQSKNIAHSITADRSTMDMNTAAAGTSPAAVEHTMVIR